MNHLRNAWAEILTRFSVIFWKILPIPPPTQCVGGSKLQYRTIFGNLENLQILGKKIRNQPLRNDCAKKNYKLRHHDHKVDRNRMSYCFRSKIFFIKYVRARRTAVRDRRTRSVNYVIVTVPLTLSGLKPRMVPTNEKNDS